VKFTWYEQTWDGGAKIECWSQDKGSGVFLRPKRGIFPIRNSMRVEKKNGFFCPR
jgi:hypothetical protein